MEEMSSTLAALLSKSGCDDDSDDSHDNHDNHDDHDNHDNNDNHDNHGSDDSQENLEREKENKSDLRKDVSICKKSDSKTLTGLISDGKIIFETATMLKILSEMEVASPHKLLENTAKHCLHCVHLRYE